MGWDREHHTAEGAADEGEGGDEDMWDAPVGASSPVAPRGGTEGATGAAGAGGGTAATCTCTGKKQLKCWVCPIFGRCKPEEVKEALKVLGAYQEDEDYSTCLLKLLRIERSQVWQGGRGGGGGLLLFI